MAYCTTADVKLAIHLEDADDDTLIATLIAQAQQAIDTACDRTFEASEDGTRYLLAGDVDGDALWLDVDLCAITSVTNGDETLVASTEYRTVPRNDTPYRQLILKSSSEVEWDTDEDAEITVAGRWAYSETAPADVQRACVRLAAWFYRQRTTGDDGDRVAVSPEGILLMPQRMPADVLAMLKPYRRLC